MNMYTAKQKYWLLNQMQQNNEKSSNLINSGIYLDTPADWGQPGLQHACSKYLTHYKAVFKQDYKAVFKQDAGQLILLSLFQSGSKSILP